MAVLDRDEARRAFGVGLNKKGIQPVWLEIENKTEIPYVLMPIHKETYLIARHRGRFEPHIRVPLPGIDVIEKVHNKGTLAAYAMERGLPTPKTWIPENREHFAEMAPRVKLPAFVKLREAASGVGIRKVKTAEELRATFEEFIDMLQA